MGIYGALATAVTGLKAQSFALENISGNIANSQTTGYKRIETDFIDLIPDAPVSRQVPGAVLANSRATNSVQGDIKTASQDTYMALNGSGFFIVDQKIGQNDGNAVFGGTSYYTRRGDFDLDKEGYLVNGSGYYLKGLDIDPTTGNISGSVPAVIQVSNSLLGANPTTGIDYRLNLPQLPKTANYDPLTPNSELMNAADFVSTPADVTATATGASGLTGTDNAATIMQDGESLTINVGGNDVTFDFYDGNAGAYTGSNIGIDVQTATPVDIDTALAAVQAGLRANGGSAAADATVGLNGGQVEVTLGSNVTDSFTVADGTTGLGLTDGSYSYTDNSIGVGVPTISGADADDFISQSVAGGAITVYASNGSPANVQLRWAKVDSAERGGTDTWRLYYLSNSNATGSDTAWVDVGQDYTFGADGSLNPPVTSTTIPNLTVNGVDLGDITMQHNASGVTQFADANGTAQVTALAQNGYPAGEFVSVTINDSGRVVASYSNGQQVELAQVVTANFNAPNALKRYDGGIYAATSESGEALLNNEGGVISAALESSNTDISEEFTKLIVTQQAYAAGTRIVSTSDQMMQEALNMLR